MPTFDEARRRDRYDAIARGEPVPDHWKLMFSAEEIEMAKKQMPMKNMPKDMPKEMPGKPFPGMPMKGKPAKKRKGK